VFQWSPWLKSLLDSKQHLLFEIKYKNGRRIKHFESQILAYLYDLQEKQLDINPNYNHHYIIVFEELQNAFGTYSMNTDDSLELMTIFTQSRSDANIHYIGIGQRLNDISTKICERLRPLVGLTIGENSLRKIKSQLPKHLRKKVQQLPKRHWIYLNGKDNPVVEIPTYHKQGKPTFLKFKSTRNPEETFKDPWKPKKPKKGLLERFLGWVFRIETKPKITRATSKDLDELAKEDSEGDGLMTLEDEDILFPPEEE